MRSNREMSATERWHKLIEERDATSLFFGECPCAAHRAASDRLSGGDKDLLREVEKEMAEIERRTLEALWRADLGEGVLVFANLSRWAPQEAARLARRYQLTFSLEDLAAAKAHRAETGWWYSPKARAAGNTLRGEWTYSRPGTKTGTVTIEDHDADEGEQS